MKIIITKREHNSSIKLIKNACVQIRPLMKENKHVEKIDQLLSTPLLWDDVVSMVKEPIIIDEDGSAIFIVGDTLVIDVPEVVVLKGHVAAGHMLDFVAAVAKPIGAIVATLGSLKDVFKAAGEHFKRTVKLVDNYSVMEKHNLVALLKERDASIDTDDLSEQEAANMLRALDKIDSARVKAADKRAAAAAAELAAFEHDAAKPSVVQDL